MGLRGQTAVKLILGVGEGKEEGEREGRKLKSARWSPVIKAARSEEVSRW